MGCEILEKKSVVVLFENWITFGLNNVHCDELPCSLVLTWKSCTNTTSRGFSTRSRIEWISGTVTTISRRTILVERVHHGDYCDETSKRAESRDYMWGWVHRTERQRQTRFSGLLEDTVTTHFVRMFRRYRTWSSSKYHKVLWRSPPRHLRLFDYH